ncbi:TRPM8 channel-associated factor homolog [Acipenser ruthenus]|uniref:TRPM8 channel-associated factor homolog n=1 Tax=Acipenser ruthenus TaxID=7906 RepID=UPI0027416F7D|nr:TRPM8 channel-associated factor homolog [Acipenser ruthenus]
MECIADYAKLLAGVEKLDFTGQQNPCDLALTGDDAFPIAMNDKGQVLIAASKYGKGRMVVLGHESYLVDHKLSWFVINAIKWLKPTPDAVIGIQADLAFIANNLIYTGDKVQLSDCFSDSMGVYCTSAYDEEHADRLIAFVKQGGGLLIAGEACQWSGDNCGQHPFTSFPGNKITSVAGIYFTSNTAECGLCPVDRKIPVSWLSVVQGMDFKEDLEFLLNGVTQFELNGSGTPSSVLVHGPMAFPIALDEHNQAFIAGARYGRGRVIVMTHEGLMSHAPLKPFLFNAMRWLDGGRRGQIGFHPQIQSGPALYSQDGFTCELTDFKEGLSVYCCTSYSSQHASEIHEFVAEGGGLLIGGHAWNWSYQHIDQNVLVDYPGNQILNRFGLGILSSTLEGRTYKAPESVEHAMKAYHFRTMLSKFAEHVLEEKELAEHESSYLKKLGQDCSSFLRMKAEHSPSYDSIRQLLTQLLKTSGVPQVCDECPVKDFKDNVLLNLGMELYNVTPDPDAILHYIIKDMPNLPTVSGVQVRVDATNEADELWRSTGLFLPPGKPTHIYVPSKLVGCNFKVQIGCQCDNLNNADVLKRAPVVTQRFGIDQEKIKVSNLWGGLIYIIVPKGAKLGPVDITVEEAVMAPYYKGGETSTSDWLQTVRHYPAPWAELEFDNIIISIPSEEVRGLDNPDTLATLWDKIMKGIAELAGIPHRFPRKERYVADVQISHGWMHAGYPVMMHLCSGKEILDVDIITKNGIWGAIHELGHNQQRGCWEFPPHTTEATCNIWSVYIHETVLNIPRHEAHGNMQREIRENTVRQYLENGAQLQNWSVWTALETYLQLQEGFGWDALKKVYADYHEMKTFCNDRDGKMNMWAETFSKAVNKNLAPFFKAWGWPISDTVTSKLAALPEWSENPMNKYTCNM